jgi:cytochrome P450
MARKDCTIAGRSVREGQLVHLMLGAANRDPARFPEPDRLDVSRTPNHHVAFGHGPHFCLGAPLARMEAKVVFRTLLRRFQKLELAGVPVRQENFVLRGLKTLPLRQGP